MDGCGKKIRVDDPATMKIFILSVQNTTNKLKASSGNNHEKKNSKRMEFMLETICDIKNNKRRPKEDPAHHTRIKKWLQKVALDGGLDIPHSDKRFVGFDKEKKELDGRNKK